MLGKRFAVPAVLAVAAVTAAGVTAATRHTQSTQAAAATFVATSVSQSQTRTCTASDGAYQETVATYKGTATSGDPRLNGPIEIRAHSVVNTTTQLGWLEAALRVRGTNAGAYGRVHAAIVKGTAVGSVVGHGEHPDAKLVASLSGPFTQNGGFAQGSAIGTGSANGAGVLFHRGDCTRRQTFTAVFHLRLTPREEVPPASGDAVGSGNLTLDLTRDASGNITGGNVVFYVNYRFPGSVTITGLALHQGAKGTNGPVVLDAAVGTFTDADGHGNLTKVIGGAAPALLQGLLTNPHGYYVELTTSTSGGLRDQLDSPDKK